MKKIAPQPRQFVTLPASSFKDHVERKGFLFPASFAQRRMWFLHELEGVSQYNVVSVKKISGPLDSSILQRCIDEIVRRHESLRTIFLSRSGELVQFIVESLDLSLQVNDLSALPANGREAVVKQAILHEANAEFDLECGPLLRAKLLRLGSRDHVLIIVIHHIVTDGWSKSVLFRELSALYEAYGRGLDSPLNDLPIQYGDYAVWQHHWFQGETLENQLGYWRQQLGSLEMLTLPTDYPRPVTQSFRGAQKHFLISSDVEQKLKALSARAKGTLYMTFLGAFQVLLHRYSGQDDIVVGSPIAGRGDLELEGLIGCFVNTLVMRTDLSGDPTFEELLCRVRETAVGAYTHQDLPFEKIVEELVSERDLSRNPIFQVMLNLHIAQESSLRLANAVMDELKRERDNVKFDLGLELTISDDGFDGILEYSRDLFEASTIDRMSGHLLTLLEGIVNQPWARLSELPILTQAERQKLLVDWNSNSIDLPSQQGIHTLFEEQAEHRADSVALIWDKQSLSYRELNRRANQLAHYLKRQGVVSEMIVGICMERGIDMVVGLLATLKAGAAYVPMDPAYPESRLELMLRDAAVTVLITTAGVNARFDEYEGQTICLDDAWQGISQENADNPATVVTGGNLAYVTYTSGSTGGPKGVMIEHHSVTALATWARQRFSDEELSGVLASTSLSFDISVFEILVPLALGGRIVLVDSIMQLPDLSTKDQIRIVNTVPSAISALVSANSIPSSVHTINLAGELLKQSLVEEIFRRTSVKRVYDLYGPSEDTVYSTCAERNAGGRASIGRPINNTEVFILDKNLNPVPVGIPGEIYLGGQGVARGYLNRPDLTTEKFIAHPFRGSSSKCLYRTGDFARYLDDGSIEFIGRADDQVKLRGFRIELGEVEAALESHPDVQEAVAVVKSDISGYEYLTAYLLAQQDADPVTADLLNFLRGLLPSYMVPTTMAKLDRFPLTLSGKVDRNALSNLADSRSEQESEKTGPRTPIEKEIVAIWTEVLNVEQVGIDDNFFELGGHSLMATQIISRIRDKLDVDLPLVKIFEVSTVAGLARAVEEASQ